MSEKFFDVYIDFGSSKIIATAFDKKNKKNFSVSNKCLSSFKSTQLNFKNSKIVLEKLILELEKKTGEYLNAINLMIDSPETLSISVSLSKKNDGKKIKKSDIQYLIQDAKQQILRNHHNKKIIHIIISNYLIDNTSYNYLPLNINCSKFSIDIKFICFPKNLIKKLEELFNSHQIFINKFICTHYAKSFMENTPYTNVCESGLKLIKGINKQEVAIVPRKLEKKGFFERLFHFFK